MTRKRTSDNELVNNTGAASASSRRKAAARPRSKHAVAPVESSLTPAAELVSQEAAVATLYQPTYEEVAQLAYLYWEARGCQGGSSEEDWLRAEAELRSRSKTASA
jgi:hypothetical protein